VAEYTETNVTQAVPFFGVSNMEQSLRFYVDGLGFEMTRKWVYDGSVRWCWLQREGAALMLQDFRRDDGTRWSPEGALGLGVSIMFMCADAIAIYREVTRRGIPASRPTVGNGMWVTSLRDPDGYRVEFESPTEVPEETVWEDDATGGVRADADTPPAGAAALEPPPSAPAGGPASAPPVRIEVWQPGSPAAAFDRDIDMLAGILHAVVHDGAGVSFVVPFSLDDARRFWTGKVLPGVGTGTCRVLVARRGERIVGTVQIDLTVPPNQLHRAEVVKLLVHPDARRRGIARALMLALEPVAQSEGRTLLTLDTWTGSPAEQLYRSLGYVAIGVIPRYARGSTTPGLEPATFMYKELERATGHQS
jgi:hypothetical protein